MKRLSHLLKNTNKLIKSENLTRVKLPKLLAQIRSLSDDRDEIISFALKLKKLDINILELSIHMKRKISQQYEK